MRLLKHSWLAFFVCCVTVTTLSTSDITGRVQADEKTRSLAVFLPETINTVSIVRLQGSAAAQQSSGGKWSRVLQEHFGHDKTGFLSWGDTLLIGSLFHPSVPEEAWATGVMHLPQHISMEAIAKNLEAKVDSLTGRPVLQTPAGNYLVKFPADVIGVYRPGLRQDAATWIAAASKKKSISIKPYLQEAIDKQGDIVLSLNLEHLLDPAFVKSKIEKDPRFARHSKLIEQIVPLISGLRGVTLSATTNQKTECEITIDFSSEVGPSASVVKTLFLSVLEDVGAVIEEFSEAKVIPSGKTVKLRCQLSEQSLHRLLSLVAAPCISANSHSIETQPSLANVENKEVKSKDINPPSERQRATKRYFNAINKKISNLQRANRNAKNYKHTIAWHENFARTIENLSPNNVEREFLVFGQRTARRFRGLASSLRGQEVEVNLKEQTLTYQTDYDPGWATANWWGGAGYRAPSVKVRSNLEQVRQQVSNAELKGFQQRQGIWDLVLEDQQEMQTRLEAIK